MSNEGESKRYPSLQDQGSEGIRSDDDDDVRKLR